MAESGGAPLRQAGDRFVGFFRELGAVFIEREDVLKQIALALLSRQHVLMTGPPGTAKSQLANRVLGRIVSEATGKPSLFARQFTESTVQTDLVGPIDFKTLMETGRTQHFTDEGILGAVHAFLDEVFDGRDMLLRSTLNVLQERELKEGTKTTGGKIECALMTSNRYLAEILDNERLVAFVDRIAFLSFVPKGFANPHALQQVFRSQVAGRKPPELRARLTIQDLDLLQTAVEAVYVDDAICDALALFVQRFDVELAAARRANPTFVPSRYLSTRTAVRVGGLLRAVCFYDYLFRDANRPLEVARSDLSELRLALTLSGPGLAETAQLLQQETDPRERRQLAIVRTEREIFDRCLAALPAELIVQRLPSEGPRLLDNAKPDALARHSSGRLLELSRDLALLATSGQREADDARAALESVLGEMAERALRSGLAMRSADATDPATLVAELAGLANDLEATGRAHVRAARWLRARALEVVERAVAFNAAPLGQLLAGIMAVSGDLAALERVGDTGLQRMERLAQLRDGLRHAGVDETDPAASDTAWRAAAQRLSDGLAPVFRAVLEIVGRRLSQSGWETGLAASLRALEPALAVTRRYERRLATLGADGQGFFRQAVGPLVAPIAYGAYRDVPGGSRRDVVSALEELTATLSASGVLHVLPVGEVMGWSIDALLRSDDAPAPATGAPGFDGYRGLRAATGNATFASVLIDLYLKLVPAGRDLLDPEVLVRRVADIVVQLSADRRQQLVRRDLAQLEVAIDYLERWWAALSDSLPANGAALETIVRSRFFEVTHDEGALTRFALEARLLAMVFGEDPAAALLGRVGTLEQATSAAARGVLTASASVAREPPAAPTARAEP